MSGAHGFVGKALSASLTRDGHEVVRLVRRERVLGQPEVEWHPNQGRIDAKHIEGFDCFVHLAGESIASGRWTDEKKRKIRESRVRGTSLLSETIAGLTHPPKIFVSASAIGYYGDRANEVLNERSAPGKGFLSDVCVEWEDATTPAASSGTRCVKTRFGIILDADGGALEKMMTPFKLGVGGRIGDGTQWMSWIALDDVVAGLRFVIDNSAMTGPVNFVAPEPVTNAEFTETMGKVLSKPTILPMPAFVARLALGEMADALLLASTRVEPKQLLDNGFRFQHQNLQSALNHILKNTTR
jgi:uncharacterized protein (TIGR01777 family)